MTRVQPRDAGFTLLEVLVALAVLALVSIALIQAQQLASLGTRRSEGRVRALSAAASLLAERSAEARSDGQGVLSVDMRYSIVSRARPDLVRPGAAIVPVERIVAVTVTPNGAARLGTIDWVGRAR